jgi:hypothetical protein
MDRGKRLDGGAAMKKKPMNLWTILVGAILGWLLVTLAAAVLVVAWRIATMAATTLADLVIP